MSETPPPFRRSDSTDTPTRLGRVETWIFQHHEWARGHSAQAAKDALDVERRVAAIESWKGDVYAAIGQIKVKLSFVMFIVASVAGIMSSIITAVLGKVLGS